MEHYAQWKAQIRCFYKVVFIQITVQKHSVAKFCKKLHKVDYELRTSLTKELKELMSIVTQFTRRFGPI